MLNRLRTIEFENGGAGTRLALMQYKKKNSDVVTDYPNITMVKITNTHLYAVKSDGAERCFIIDNIVNVVEEPSPAADYDVYTDPLAIASLLNSVL